MAANPDDTTRLALDEEVRTIEVKLRGTTHQQDIELLSRWAIRPDDLLQYLNELQPDIVHFSGHGTRGGELMLVGDDGVAQPVGAAALRRVFGLFNNEIRAVVLNACFSETQARAIAEKIDCVVGMAIDVGDVTARVFAGAFYRALGYGKTLRNGFEQGTTAIELAALGEQSTPQIIIREPGGDWRVGGGKTSTVRRTVFMAYAPEDKPWLDRLQIHLKPHLMGKAIDLWETGRVQAGSHKREVLEQALAAAEVAILLVTADFLAAEVIVDEQLPRLLAAEDGNRLVILPLVVGACAFKESPIERFQPLNAPERPLDELTRPEQNRELVRIAKVVAEIFKERFGG